MISKKRLEKSPEIEVCHDAFENGRAKFMVDTGAEVNLIKIKCIKSNIFINRENKIQIFGINKEGVTTIGEIQVDFGGDVQSYQLVPDDFPVKQDGLLGMPFLKNSTINLNKKILYHKIGNFPFLTNAKARLIKIKSRSKQLVELPVINKEDLSVAYMPLIPTGPGVYLGKTLVSINNGLTKTFCINTTSRDLELLVPPIEVFDFIELEPSPRNEKQRNLDVETKESEKERFEKLKEALELDHLNEFEKEQLLLTLKKHLYQFHLPDDKLGFTKDIQHSIETTDELPVNSKYPRYPEVHKQEIKEQTEKLLKNKSIVPSKSPYNSPVWIVPKKEDAEGNKRWRMVIDYRKLNEKTISDVYPIPNITEILDQVGGG